MTPLTNEIVDQRIAGRPIVRLGEYLHSMTPLLWGCTSCDREWLATFSNINKGGGCPACSNNLPLTNEIVDQRLTARPIQRLSNFKQVAARMLWGCTGCGYEWEARFSTLNEGHGCPVCASSASGGFDPSKPAILYYLRVGNLYKPGVTNRTVAKRFPNDMWQITIVHQWHYAKGADAYKREQNILSLFAEDLYTGPPVLVDNGNTELFTRDILQLETAA